MTLAWGIFEADGATFDLSHLDQAITSIEIGGEEHAILVEFSDHCFTEEAVADDPRPKFTPSTRTDGRFCEKRYQASLDIWEHIERAMKGPVWLGEDDRCLIVKVGEGENPMHYVIPFTLQRWKGDERAKLKMRVRSAFIRDSGDRVATFGQVRFATLVQLTLKGKSPTRNYDRIRKRPW
ncbi:hypothetical protein JQ617_15600 [Bradyrhizobium sp. KB893862 SZCCT0404]|uniref:hypothetical protein n=1 Tax=Bradyrhizobium sp. KB893862 SZCCT0404 TaxID=2807672 RepID=UPI001BAC0F2D|nr:hypothetical protein [Bradyrhizobium sp. KB893862 SZCCT0404]MBR1175387.1 hypothetical protein [Bradyrhizobium sp. KB893862 SZCCT0404]